MFTWSLIALNTPTNQSCRKAVLEHHSSRSFPACIVTRPILAALAAPRDHLGHSSCAPLHTASVLTTHRRRLDYISRPLGRAGRTTARPRCPHGHAGRAHTLAVVARAHTFVFTHMGWHMHLRRRRETNPPTDRIRPVCHQTYVAPYPRISLALISALAPP